MLKGQNIVLRPLEDSDVYLLDKIENSSEYWEFGSEKKKYSRQELADYILNAKTDISVAKQYRFVIDFFFVSKHILYFIIAFLLYLGIFSKYIG